MNFSSGDVLDVAENMHRDTVLLSRAEKGELGCRVYDWIEPSVTLGRFQSPERDLIDPDAIPWAIRPTGGKAVLHGHDITIGMAVPLLSLAQMGVPARSLKSIYRSITVSLIDALKQCGLPAELGENTRFVSKGPRTADCFAHISANDIVSSETGVKVCGCALRLTQDAVLLQASVPAREPLVDPRRVLKEGKPVQVIPWDFEGFPSVFSNTLTKQFSDP